MMAPSEPPPLRARLARSIFWIVWSRGVIQLLAFGTTLLVARILEPKDYSEMAIASVFTATMGMLVEMELGAAIIQFRDLDNRELNTCFWITMILATCAYAGLFLASSAVAHWFSLPRLAELLPALALTLPISACSVVSDGLLRKRLALDRISQAQIFAGLVTLPVTLGCALGGLGVWALVAGSLVAPAVRSAATITFSPWYPTFQIGGKRMKEVLHFSLTTLGVRMLSAVREDADVVVVGKLSGDVTLGIYSMAKQLALLPTSKISGIVNALSSPVMAELQTDIHAMREAFYRAVRLTAVISVPMSVGMALVADEMVAVLLGAKWSATVPLLQLLCAYAGVRALDVLFPPVLFARRRQKFLLLYCLTLFIAVPVAAIFGAIWKSATGVVIASTIAYCTLMVIMAKETLREIKGAFSELWIETWPIFAAAAAMAASVFLVRDLMIVGPLHSSFARLVISCLVGATTYATTLLIIGSPVISEGAQLLGWLVRRGVHS
jgi:O-antigen/teichoic acid export membrane protein